MKTQETVSLEEIKMAKPTNHKAYKLYVPESKVSVFLDESLWPTGIIFRRFIPFKHRNINQSKRLKENQKINNGQ